MILPIAPVVVAHPVPTPVIPPIVQGDCKYQVMVNRNQPTFKCLTEDEYQKLIASDKSKPLTLGQIFTISLIMLVCGILFVYLMAFATFS